MFARPKASSTARGYGPQHQRARAAALAELQRNGVGTCAIGGEPIYPASTRLPRAHPRALVFDHCPCRTGCVQCNGTGYRGLACWAHNATDGARRGRARQNVTRLRW